MNRASITINATSVEVWNALVNPEAIKQYMFGTNVVSKWHEGSPIVWKESGRVSHMRTKA